MKRMKAPIIIFASITSIYVGIFVCKRSDGSQAMAVLTGFGMLFMFIIYKAAYHPNRNRRAVIANVVSEDAVPAPAPAPAPATTPAPAPASAPDKKYQDTISHNNSDADIPPSYEHVCKNMCIHI